MTTSVFTRADEIAETFSLIKTVHPSKLQLPVIRSIDGKLKSYPMPEVIADAIWNGSVAHEMLLDVLHHSECPYVAQLLQVISDKYKEDNAEELDLYDQERGNV